MRDVATAIALLALLNSACSSTICGPDLFDVQGVCVRTPVCSEECGAHQICEGRVTPYACKCAPGYAGNPCAWIGVVGDPGFERLKDAEDQPYWVDEGGRGASLEPGGEGVLPPSVACNAGALSQTMQMPPYQVDGRVIADLLVAEVTYQAQNVEGLAVGFERAWRHVPATGNEWDTVGFCLGEAAFGESPVGGPIKVQVSASERAADCFPEEDRQGTIRIDHLTIAPAAAGRCPEPGAVLNGKADVGGAGWTFVPLGDPDATLVAGVGQAGSDGARLFRDVDSPDLKAMSTQVSVPLPDTLASPAIRFWWKGTAERAFQVAIGTFVGIGEPRRSVDRLIGNDNERNNIYCLPPWTHGNVVDFSFVLVDEDSIEDAELIVDDLELISDPDCGDATELLDPGFESAPNRWMGVYLSKSRDQAVVMQNDEERARSGAGALEMTYWTTDAELRIESFVLVPEADGTAGPQLVFYSDVPAEPESIVEWVLGKGEEDRKPLVAGGDWLPNEVCLPPEWSGRWFRFQVRVGPAAEPGQATSLKRIFLDDFELTTSPKCRALP